MLDSVTRSFGFRKSFMTTQVAPGRGDHIYDDWLLSGPTGTAGTCANGSCGWRFDQVIMLRGTRSSDLAESVAVGELRPG